MSYLERGGVSIYYQCFGRSPDQPPALPRPAPPEPGKLPLLLSHGFGATSAMWDPNIAALSAQRQVITWDLRGHGRSGCPDEPGEYTQAACVEDMVAVLDAAGAAQAVLGGLSLGGYLSLAFCLRYPERVAALLLCDTGPGFRSDEARQRWNDRAAGTASRLERDGLAALRGGLRYAVESTPRGLALAARGILTQQDARVIDSLPSIAVPVLVLVGARDEAFLGAADYATAKIPGARQAVIPDAGHMCNIDQPELFDEQVLKFLDDLT